MELITAIHLLNTATVITYLSGAGEKWEHLIGLLHFFIWVFMLTQILLKLVKTAVSTVWRRADTFVSAFLGTFAAAFLGAFAAVYVALMVYNN